MNQEERKQTITLCYPEQASSLVYMWVKSKVITLREFKELYPLIDIQCDPEDDQLWK